MTARHVMTPAQPMSCVGPIRLPEPLIGQMDDLAGRLGYSRSALIRQAVRQYVRQMATAQDL
jgi:metal-responsive CopG/Arc/MetJ family transcriptional regulator